MKNKIYSTLCLLSLLVMGLTTACILLVYYNVFTDQIKLDLQSQCSIIASDLEYNEDDTLYLNSLQPHIGELRVTLVSAGGDVAYDSLANVSSLTNHLSRPEIIMAQQTGSGEAIRQSDTLGYNYYYYAQRLSNGDIIRIAQEANNIGSIFVGVLPGIVVICIIIFVLGIILASRLTKKILGPIDAMAEHMTDKEDYPFYDELAPFISQIRKQKQEIKDNYQALSQEKELIDTITHSMQEGLILIDRDKKIISINNSALHFLDVIDDNYRGQNILYLSRSRELITAIEQSLGGENSSFLEQKNDHYYRLLLNPVFSDQTITSVIILIVDVTREQQAEKMRHDFTANVSHELKTPLTSICGYAEMIENDMIAAPTDRQKFAKRISKESKRLLALIEDIIRLSQIEDAREKQLQKVDLYQAAQDAVQNLGVLAAQKQVELTITGSSTSIYADPYMIDELLYNLIDNAIKYNQPQGHVSIRVATENQQAVLAVTDNGIGIAPADQVRLFERFYRVDKSRSKETGGTGLGLSIVKHIVEYHQGTIELESAAGQGTSITVRFPL